MSAPMPQVPSGSGKHPIGMIAIAANRLAESADFYSQIFGWQTFKISDELVSAKTPAGPAVSLRANTAAGFPGVVPFIRVDDVDVALQQVGAAAGAVERAPWVVPMVGKLARFKDACGTIYGLMAPTAPTVMPPLPPPFGNAAKPPVGAVCSLEMFAEKGQTASQFFGGQFGWGCAETMPRYVMFDPGAGIGGVFQSHTPTLTALGYVYVADVAATLKEIDAAGGRRTAEPMSVPGLCTFGYFKDPSGTDMGLMGP